MKICAKEARRLKSKIEFRNCFGVPGAVRILRIFEEVVVGLVEELARLGKALEWKICYFVWVFCASVDVGRFLDLNKYASFRLQIHQPFRGFFGLIFPTKRTFEPTVLLLKKAARCHPLSHSSPVFVSQPLAVETF